MTLKAGKLGALDVPAGADTVLYTCGSGAGNTAAAATASIWLCNRGAAPVKFRVAVSAADAPTAAEYIEYDTTLAVGGVFERSGLALSAGERIVVRTDIATLSARAHGFEK